MQFFVGLEARLEIAHDIGKKTVCVMFGMERTFRHSAATVDTQPKKRKRRARKNVDFDGEVLQRLPLPTPTACEIDPDEETRMEEYDDLTST